MLSYEDVIKLRDIEQNFGNPYSDLDTVWREYEFYMSERFDYLHCLKLDRTSIPPIDCSLKTMERVKESIRRTQGDEIIKQLRLTEVEADIKYVSKLKGRMVDYVEREQYANIGYERFRQGIREAGHRMEKRN